MVCGELAEILNLKNEVESLKKESEKLKQIVAEVVDILADYIDEHYVKEEHFYDEWLMDHSAELKKLLE